MNEESLCQALLDLQSTSVLLDANHETTATTDLSIGETGTKNIPIDTDRYMIN